MTDRPATPRLRKAGWFWLGGVATALVSVICIAHAGPAGLATRAGTTAPRYDNFGATDPTERAVELVSREGRDGPPDLQLRWQRAGPSGRRSPIPSTAYASTPLRSSQRVARAWSPVALWILCGLWLAAGAFGVACSLTRMFPSDSIVAGRAFAWACVTCAVLFSCGIWWGWPGPGWPPDELDPGIVINAWEHRFSGGWYDKYPPVHFYLLTLAYAPVLVVEQFARVDVFSESANGMLYLMGRFVSLILSVGTVAAIGLLAIRLGYRRHSWLAVLLAATFLPMPFYAKTANVDALYLFFFAVSLLFMARASLDGRLTDFVGLGIFAALAVASKDQAYALYALPGLYLAGRAIAGGPSAPRKIHILVAASACVVTWALAQNVVFNPEGVREHVLTITGPASSDYRMFSATWRGHLQLLAAVSRQIVDCFSWAGLFAVAAGVYVAPRLGLPATPAWFWLVPLSYYLTFAAVVGYSYDRFLLPSTILFAIPAAVGLGHLLARMKPVRWHRPLGAFLLAWIVMRAVGVNALMLGDARYAAEAWLRREVPAAAVVGSFGQSVYLPRLGSFNHVEVRPGIAETLALAPDFIVLNAELLRRFEDDTIRMTWLHWLESGTGPYREVFRYKAPVPWYSPLALDARLRDRVEDPFSNLDKINPEIAIFRRIEPTAAFDR